MGMVITLIFNALAFLTTILSTDKTRGIGAAILLWLFFTMIYDALLLYIIMIFSDYPIERPITTLLMLNPLDMVRFQVILKMDVLAMMGYSGAAFKEFLGETLGTIISTLLLLLWIVVPYLLSLIIFKRKDL
jgi:Cu-processing system permease protein